MSEWKESEIGKIPNNWSIKSASKFCIKVTDGTHDSPKQKEKGYPLITSKHIKGDEINFADAYLISKEDYDDINQRSKVHQWDVIISMIGEYCGFSYIEENEKVEYAIKNVGLFKPKNELDSKWLYYYLQGRQAKHYISFSRTGTSQPYITLSSLRDFPILIPSSEEEKMTIVKINDCIRSKITLLRQQNQDLEELAQTLFKRWFVEFEFPNENGEPYKSSGGKMVESELGEIPEGWKLKPLDSILRIHNGYSYKGSELQESDIALVTLKNFDRNGGFRFDGFKELVSENYKEKHIVNVGDLIVAHTDLTHDAEVLGNPAIIMKNDKYKELVISMDLVKVESKLEEITTAFLYYLMRDKRFKSHCKGYSNGTTVLHLSKTAIPEYMFAFPEKMNLIKDFGQYAKSVYDKISINVEEIQTLTKLRDTLLPKLMSGELRVNINQSKI